LPDSAVERAIATRFTEIADNGWFPEDLPADDAQLREVRAAVAPERGMKILDAGCARGRFVKQLLPSGARIYGVDLTERFLHAAKNNVPDANFVRGTLSALPFPSESFDAVYCLEVLEHLPDTELALSELCRVLKPGGVLLVIDKSLRGLFAWSGLPNLIAKPLMERRGQWMYPPDFVFRERWFWPGRLTRQIRKFCRSARYHYLTDGRGKASRFYRIFPFLSMDIAWIGKK
jgi:ubiquinone/menaquinone biosynthesis C-methylase UbiE